MAAASVCRKTMSLRASGNTGVAIPRIFELFWFIIVGFRVYLGDRHTILRDGSR